MVTDAQSYASIKEDLLLFQEHFRSRSPHAESHIQALKKRHGPAWGVHPIPDWSVAPAWRLKLFLAEGLGSQMDPPDRRMKNLEDLRVAALRANAPLVVHDLLRGEGLPPMSEKTASQEGARVLDSAQHLSVQAIYDDQPAIIIKSITEPSGVGAPKAVYRFFEKPSSAAIRMLEILDRWGADWELPRVVSLVDQQPQEKQKIWESQHRKLLEMRMERTLSEQGVAPSPRVRL